MGINNILRILIILAFVILAGLAVYFDENVSTWGRLLESFLVAIGPELAGIAIGFITIDALNERRHDLELKRQLILQIQSKEKIVIESAFAVLKAKGWFSDGTLAGQDLKNVDWEGLDLKFINLKEARLDGSNLKNVNFSHANLEKIYFWDADAEGANLSSANLNGARLSDTNFKNANLTDATLKSAFLIRAILANANLTGANLQYASLEGSKVSRTTWPSDSKIRYFDYSLPRWWLREKLFPNASEFEVLNFLNGTIMPDYIQLKAESPRPFGSDYPSIQDWLYIQELRQKTDLSELESILENIETVNRNKCVKAELIVRLWEIDPEKFDLRDLPILRDQTDDLLKLLQDNEEEYFRTLHGDYTVIFLPRVFKAIEKLLETKGVNMPDRYGINPSWFNLSHN